MPSQLQKNTVEASNNSEISLIDILLILANHKRKIILVPFFGGVIGVLISLMLPNIYRANTKILPPQQNQSTASTMLNQLSGLTGGVGASLGIKNPNDLYIALLKSRTITDKLIQRFDLKTRYNKTSLENTRIQLESQSLINSGKDNLISIDVEDKDPKVAAEIANAYVEELTLLTSKFALTEASQRRIFYERQLGLVRDRMISAENSLANNISNSGLTSVDIQSRTLLETTSRLRANISAKEVQLRAMQAFVTPNSLQYKSAQQELIGMKMELSKLESGTEFTKNSDNHIDNNSIKQNSSSSNNFQALRDVKYHQMLYELIAKQYEIARLDEAKDIPVIQVLDRAIEPEKKIKPQRTLIVIIFSLIGLILAFAFVFTIEYLTKSNSEEKNRKINELKNNLSKF